MVDKSREICNSKLLNCDRSKWNQFKKYWKINQMHFKDLWGDLTLKEAFKKSKEI